jgi:hypothetical protein
MKKLSRIILHSIGKFAGNRWTRLAVFGVLIATSLVEVAEDVDDIRAHHGVLVFAVANLFRTLPDIFYGAEDTELNINV